MNSDQIYDLIGNINAASGRNEKEKLLETAISDHTLIEVLRAAYDPLRTYGVTPGAIGVTGGEGLFNGSRTWELLETLRTRRLTGNLAKIEVSEMMRQLSRKSATLLSRILNKDLRCGITATTINKVAPGTVPLFGVMLAHKYEEKRIKTFPVGVEPKLDGLRVMGLMRGNDARFFSRTGKPFPALDWLAGPVCRMVNKAWETATLRMNDRDRSKDAQDLARLYRQLLGGDSPQLVIDSEVIAGSFNKTTGDVRRKSEIATDAVLHMFEALPYDKIVGEPKSFGMVFKHRRKFLEFVFSFTASSDPIRMTPLELAHTHEQVQNFYTGFRNHGYEGAMVKPLDGLYVKTRSHAWLKMKNQASENLRVVGAFEGTGKYEGQLGGLIVDRAGVQVRVGGGFSDEQRAEIWADWLKGESPEIGFSGISRAIEVEFHEITPDGSLRHPRFSGWREEHELTSFELTAAA